MITRREYLKLTMALGATAALPPSLLWAGSGDEELEMITRTVPSSGEALPVIGLGSSATFSQEASSEDVAALRNVLQELVANGGQVFDTAPAYGASEAVAGRLANELGITDELFWATKLNVAGRGGDADREEARAQVETSFERVGKDPIDLIQVHNVAAVDTQLDVLKAYREEGRVRHIGVTNTFSGRYDDLEQVMRNEPIDFIGIDYAIDNQAMEERILPLAEDRGIGVLVYAPFGRTRLWERVEGKRVPAWAAEFDAHSWAQFFLKFVVANPRVTAATPATSNPRHMVDNMGAAMGRLPDAEMRQRMVQHIESL